MNPSFSRASRALFFLLPVLMLATPDASHAADANPAPTDPLAKLRDGHPRLLLTPHEWAAFDQRVKNRKADKQFDALMSRLEKDARRFVAVPPSERRMTGRRLLGVSREVLGRVLTLAVVHRATGEKIFLERAEKEMLAAAAFDDWNPSHFLDVGEMTTALALGYDWLFAGLPQESRAVIRRAIIEKGLEKGLNPKLRHNGWHRSENNWNQVCWGGMTLGALAIAEDEPALARPVLAGARAGIGRGLKPYEPDGIYPEGPGYWNYGTAYQVLMIAALESALGTDWDLCARPGFMASASVQLHLTGPTGAMFNFSDCGNMKLFDPVFFWFAKKLNDPALAVTPDPRYRDRFLALAALWWPEGGLPPAGRAPALPLAWKGGGPNPVAVFRSSWTDPDALYLACKAGVAANNHGHMDAGSFILEADGVRWAIDLGMQSYETLESKGMRIFGRTQDAQRWTIFRMNNFSHNTLTIGGRLHKVDGRAEFVAFTADARMAAAGTPGCGAKMDLSAVFAGQASRVTRVFQMLPASRTVRVIDHVEGAAAGAEVRWAMATRAEVEISADGDAAVLRQNGKILRAGVSSSGTAGALRFEVIPADPPPHSYDAPNPGVRFLVVRAVAAAKGGLTIGVELAAGAK